MQSNKKQSFQQSNQSKLTSFLYSRGINKPDPEASSRPQNNHPTVYPSQQQRKEQPSQSPNQPHSPSHTQSLNSSLSALSRSPVVESKSPPPLQSKPEEKVHVNVEFYMNKMPSRPNGEFIAKMHSDWRDDYERLQRDHAFIQWLFPNSFQSRFNAHAKPLSLEEAAIFKGNQGILERYVTSYTMMLAFYGIRMKSKVTGQLCRSRHPDFKERFYKTLLTSFHNHMRITRILCSLSELGFGIYATQLCRFLKDQIHRPWGELRHLEKYKVYEQWRPFETADQDHKNTNIFMERMRKGVKQQHPEKKEAVGQEKQKQELADKKGREGEAKKES